MARALFLVTIAIVLGVLAGRTAYGQGLICGQRDAVLKELLERYGEVPVSYGLDSRGVIVEIAASPSGTWTLIFSGPTGVSCLMGDGENFRLLPTTRKGSF